jgi:hypothetical protein
MLYWHYLVGTSTYQIGIFLILLSNGNHFLPLLLMPNETWQSLFALSLPGQYIIKNVVLIASAYTIYHAEGRQRQYSLS